MWTNAGFTADRGDLEMELGKLLPVQLLERREICRYFTFFKMLRYVLQIIGAFFFQRSRFIFLKFWQKYFISIYELSLAFSLLWPAEHSYNFCSSLQKFCKIPLNCMYFFWPFLIAIYRLVQISASERPLVDRHKKKAVLVYSLLFKFWYLKQWHK